MSCLLIIFVSSINISIYTFSAYTYRHETQLTQAGLVWSLRGEKNKDYIMPISVCLEVLGASPSMQPNPTPK